MQTELMNEENIYFSIKKEKKSFYARIPKPDMIDKEINNTPPLSDFSLLK